MEESKRPVLCGDEYPNSSCSKLDSDEFDFSFLLVVLVIALLVVGYKTFF